MRVETEVTWGALRAGERFRWEPDGNLWVAVEVGVTGLVAGPWQPEDWPERCRRAPALYQPEVDRTVWRMTPDV